MERRHWLWILIVALQLGPLTPPAAAQYFGRNKVQYKTFDFKVLKTDHFDIYYYEAERVAAENAARMAERWYARLSRVLDHELSGRQPLILYASHPEFEQTNAIAGELGEGTGGVTEIMKRRIVLPLAGTLGETDHVIGHELVHAFQFDITRRKGGSAGFSAPTAIYLPLWFVEGMAEYLSIGPTDPHTAMWLRDAAHENKLPSITQLSDPNFFPYRYGQAIWSYLAGRWGDDVVGKILKATDRNGDVRPAVEAVLGMSADSIALGWHQAIRDWNTEARMSTDSVMAFARPLLKGAGRGRLNLAPSLSPDGEYVMFYSERDLFSIELFLAEVKTGRIVRRVTRTAIDPHLQSLQFIQSAGAWSPDGKRFALAAVANGVPLLRVIDVDDGDTVQDVVLEELGEILNPTWSPDGRRVIVSAMIGGVTDLVVVDLESGGHRRLTEDVYSDIAPSWSPDGRRIAFVTDRFTSNLEQLEFGEMRIALVDPETGTIEALSGADQGKNISPQWSSDGRLIYFISDRNGVSNLYRVAAEGGTPEAMTNLLTGISGITKLSPALSTARKAERLVFSAYEAGGYNLYAIDSPAESRTTTPTLRSDPTATAVLPPRQRENSELSELITDSRLGLVAPEQFRRSKYRAGLGLDYVSTSGIGLAAGSTGIAVVGGTSLSFSDMLGNHNLQTIVQMNNSGGSFLDNLAAVVQYYNLESRANWGLQIAQIPYITSSFSATETVIDGEPVFIEQEVRSNQIEREIMTSVAYPFSRVQRVEFSAGYRNISFHDEVQRRTYSMLTDQLIEDVTLELESGPGLHLATGGLALVYDTAIFGGTSPVLGQSYRLEVGPVLGDMQYFTAMVDYRRYIPVIRPLVLAGRVIHFGRYGRDGEDPRLTEPYLGSAWLMHGYDDASFTVAECTRSDLESCPAYSRLLGSRLAVGNVELRLPIFGALGVVPSPGVPPLELTAFYDTGVAWRSNDQPRALGGQRELVSSYGGAVRMNLLGFAIAEAAFVHPNDRPVKGWYWQITLQPGF